MFRIHNSTIGKIVSETLQAIWNSFAPIHMAIPTPVQLQKSALLFEAETGFPNVAALLDGKHFALVNLPQGGNENYNRKGFHSVNLQGN